MHEQPSAIEGSTATGVDLVIIGHVGTNQEHSPFGERVVPGGAGYAAARGAAVLAPRRVGLVAVVGGDHDPGPLERLGVDTRGVRRVPGASARFRIVQHPDGSRSFHTDLGVAAQVSIAVSGFPAEYAMARHAHLCTAPPEEQLAWLEFLRALPGRMTVSADVFEHYARTDPEGSRAILERCDLRFLNEEEERLLFGGLSGGQGAATGPLGGKPTVIKYGPGGAAYTGAGGTGHVPADRVTAVDTTHAGEILAGVFLALRLASSPPGEALRLAVRAATAKVTQFGVEGSRLLRVLAGIRATHPEDRSC